MPFLDLDWQLSCVGHFWVGYKTELFLERSEIEIANFPEILVAINTGNFLHSWLLSAQILKNVWKLSRLNMFTNNTLFISEIISISTLTPISWATKSYKMLTYGTLN
jgi:hypothetical protein